MNRRTFSTLAPAAFVTASLPRHFTFAQSPRALALPSADQRAWQDLEIGMFVHISPGTWQNAESDTLKTPLSQINPAKLDTDQWARTALSFGAKYIVFVAKHQGGFCMWQTQTTDYSIRNTPYKDGKGDVLAEVAASCRKFGLKLGAYVCPRDDHFGAKTGGICATPELQEKYNAMYREQWTEVLSRYGPLVEVWFDGSSATPVGDLLSKYQPHAMVFQGPQATIRWVGNEDGFAPNPLWNGIDRATAKTGTSTSLNSDPDGDTWLPSEVDVSIRRPHWFWGTQPNNKVLTAAQLLSIYYNSVGRGAQLLLNIPPNTDGLLADEDVAAAKTLGDEIKRRFATPIAHTSGNGAAITLKLSKPTQIDTVILAEDIAKGERVRAFKIEGHMTGVALDQLSNTPNSPAPSAINSWQTLAEGISIGHKRILPLTSAATVSALRLTVTKYAALPSIRTFAVYNTNTPPPADWNAVAQIYASNSVGRWRNNAFTLDLTKRITVAAQYRLRFMPASGSVTAITGLTLNLNGVPNPTLLKPVPGKPNELLLDITGVGETIQITGKIEGAPTGQVLLQKL